ncbi:MAG: hypothetical protein GKR89_35695 [Candidatus Latescibacteria bacterium]|nr:hypothetical protein [Candidatus Latescibacterota bacterium]
MFETIYYNLAHRIWQLLHWFETHLQGTYTGFILASFWDLFTQLWYFVLFGAFISTLVWLYLPKAWIRQRLQRHTRASVLVAILLGLLSPLCTFAAIPIVGSLIALGVPAVPLVAFMVTSPLMNPALFIYTTGIIGPEMALARVLTACSVGLVAAYATHLGLRRGLLRFDAPALERVPRPLYAATVEGTRTGPVGLKMAGRRFLGDLSFIGRFFALGIAIAALAQNLLSEDMVLTLLGPGSLWAVPMAVALGIPLYACGGGSLPVVDTMMQIGMGSGAALAFFIAGPATKFSTLTMLGAVFGRRLLLFYMGIMLTSALFWGYLYPFRSQYL